MVIRGAVYQVDLGQTRGHEQRGRRLGVVLSPTSSLLSVAVVVPTSTSAQPAVTRPQVHIAGRPARLLVDQIRTIDTDYVVGEPVDYLTGADMAELEHTVARYLGLVPEGR
ncbi:MAG: type II toxin-antitoxin system PemK/MazF family toxin [Micrococcales bacterium]|nr:type II toxin-antitoxin system PemK/MazF family toxin [Micrococcales bacterium]MCL2668703.1 type II toxin-antitoxin system PemK/MazF family toxin [Micrococcales bacterium]